MNYLQFVLILAASGVVKSLAPEPTCKADECTCEKGYLLSQDQAKCLPYVTEYNGECSEAAQCEWFGENIECNYVCRCKEGYRWYLGQCAKYVGLGEACSSSLDCFDGYSLESFACVSGKCSCSEGYYQRGDTDCRKIATALDDICALDIDCQVPNEETVCNIGKCKRANEIQVQEYMLELEYPSSVSLLEEECGQCDNITNAECYEKTGLCVCKKSYFYNGEECVAELGVDAGCSEDSDCPIKPGKCVNNVCYCRDYYFVAEGNKQCVKTISEKNWNCLSREWCYALGPYSYCSSDGTCKCSKISDLDDQNSLCIKNGEDSEICTTDLQCRHMTNALCIDEECGCETDTILSSDNSTCLRALGASCTDLGSCNVENSECLDSKCQCIENYVAFGNTECLIRKDSLGDECEKDIQCSASIVYSECPAGECVCRDDRVAHNNSCYAKTDYGSYCNNRLECSLSLEEMLGDSVQCRNRKCQCPTGYTLKENVCSSGGNFSGNFIVTIVVLVLNSVFS